MCNFITATKRHAALLQSSGLDVVPSGPLWARASLCVCCASLVLFAYDVQIFIILLSRVAYGFEMLILYRLE